MRKRALFVTFIWLLPMAAWAEICEKLPESPSESEVSAAEVAIRAKFMVPFDQEISGQVQLKQSGSKSELKEEIQKRTMGLSPALIFERKEKESGLFLCGQKRL